MVKLKYGVFALLIIFFLLFSFYPTIFEIKKGQKLADPNREFVLEHNFYFPDFNLYLSKIRQGFEGHWTAKELYTSEKHEGSLIQEFYVVLGQLGRVLGTDPNSSYLLGRIILSPLLLGLILTLSLYFFRTPMWQILSFLVTVISGSYPRIFTDLNGNLSYGRYMEWWSNIDSLQRITFIPHILFGQVVSFLLLYLLTINNKSRLSGIHDAVRLNNSSTASGQKTVNKAIILGLFGNLAGLVFPPSLITLNATIILLALYKFIKPMVKTGNILRKELFNVYCLLLFVLCSLPSLLYFLIVTKQVPWSTLVISHKLHPMLIPLDQYLLGLGPVFFLGASGAVISIIRREVKFRPLILFVIANLGLAAFFSVIRQQSPLRFTQTGLFIPLGILGTYFFYQVYQIRLIRPICLIVIILYLLISLLIMKSSLDWQTNWITQKVNANLPPVPYPPQAMYPLKEWMRGINWLKINTKSDDVVLAEVTASNHIPSYSGNTVYFGQLNTVNYEDKEIEVKSFLKGQMNKSQAESLIAKGRIKYVFYSTQEKETSNNLDLMKTYPFLKSVYNNPLVTIYSVN